MTTKYLDEWFRPGGPGSAATYKQTAPVVEAAPQHPWWHSPWHPPDPAAAPGLPDWARRLLLAEDEADTDYIERVRLEYAAGRVAIGRAISEAPDAQGRVVLARTVRVQAVPVLVDHAGPSVGRAVLIPRPDRADVLAIIVLDDSARGRLAARVMAGGGSGLSVRGQQSAGRPGGWRAGDPFTVEHVALVGTPQDPSCRVLTFNHDGALDFSTRILHIDHHRGLV
jgi:hypothetical protein